jgi:integrase/recombinase XerD
LSPEGQEVGAELARCVDAYLQESLARGHSKDTVAYRRVHLRQLLGWLRQRGFGTTDGLTPRVLADYVGHLAQRLTRHNRRVATPLAGTTKAAAVSVVRSFGAWLAACEVLPANPAHDLHPGRWVAPIPKAVLTVADVERLLETPGEDTRGLRDRAILETLYSTGLRRAELCRLDLYDLDFCAGAVLVRQGKGSMDRVVPIGATALRALRRYFRESRPRSPGREDERAVFLASVTRRRLLPKTLNYLVRKYSKMAGLGTRVTPHLLRHTCMTHLLQGGARSEDVRAILGHVSVGTTHIYTRVTVEDLAAAHARHHPRENLGRP